MRLEDLRRPFDTLTQEEQYDLTLKYRAQREHDLPILAYPKAKRDLQEEEKQEEGKQK